MSGGVIDIFLQCDKAIQRGRLQLPPRWHRSL